MKRVKYGHNRSIVDTDYDKKIRVKNIENVKELKGCRSLADVFKTLADVYAYVVYKPKGLRDRDIQDGYYRRELAMAKDIRFDYVNKEIFIPVCRYRYNLVNIGAKEHFKLGNIKKLGYNIDSDDYIQYNRFYDKIVLWSKGKYVAENLDIILGDVQNNLRYLRLNISKLPIYEYLGTENVHELYIRYIKCCYYGGRDTYIDSYFYESDKYSKLKNKHRKVLNSLSLNWYGKECEMFSRGFRKYKFENIKCILTEEEMCVKEMYEKCLIDFESYLLAKLLNGSYWTGWNGGYTFKQFKNGEVYFLKYKEKLPLVLLADVLLK